jgi:hypothetical protein
MMRRILKLAAYTRAPKATFALLHPIRALKWGAAFYVGRKLYRRARSLAEPRPGEGVPSAR